MKPNKDADVIGAMLWEKTKKEYPYLADKELQFKYSPTKKSLGGIEFFDPEETGSPESPRPKEFVMGKPGVEVYNTNTRPLDILADYVSHYGVKVDPTLSSAYQQFSQSLTPRQKQILKNQYEYYQKDPKFRETRPYEDWESISGLPGYFRGYTFNQWKKGQGEYTPEQLKNLDQVRKYLNIK